MPFGKKASSAGATDILQKFSDLYSNSSGEDETINISAQRGTLKRSSQLTKITNDLRKETNLTTLNNDIPKQPPSIELGNDLVQKLLVQLTMNDSPPSNIGVTKNKKVKGTSMTEPGQFSSSLSEAEMVHINPLSVNGPVSLKQQGHLALAKLCTRALDNLGKKSRFQAPKKKNLSSKNIKINI